MNAAFNRCQKVWINARIATMDQAIEAPYGMLEDHVIGVADGRIEIIALRQEFACEQFQGQLIDGRGGLMTPGLIDSHTHLLYGGNRAEEFNQRQNGLSYAEISRAGGGILATVRATRALSEAELVAESRPRLEALLNEGVTTVEIKSGYGLTLLDELKMLRAARLLAADYPLRLRSSLLAAHAIPPEFQGAADDYVDLICKELIPQAADEQLAEAIDVYCEQIAFSAAQCEKIFHAAQTAGLGIKVHAEQLSNSHAAELAARFSAWSVDHLEYLDETGIRALQKSGTIATLLPGAFYFLGETKKPPVELMRRHRIPLALASDLNPGSSPLASLRLMMNMGCVLFGLTPEEALQGATRNAAAALGLGAITGTLSAGKAADLLLWDIADPAQLAYQFGATPLRQRIFAGEISHV